MSTIPELTLLSGKPFPYHGYTLVPPKLERIADENDIGYNNYQTASYLFWVSKEEILNSLDKKVREWYSSLPNEEKDKLSKYYLLTNLNIETLTQAIQMFVAEKVVHNEQEDCFYLYKEKNKKPCAKINNENFLQLCAGINQINYRKREEDDEVDLKFSSEKARKLYERMKQKRAEFEKNKAKNSDNLANFEIGNVVNSLSAKGKECNLNILNIWSLTPYQLYAQFSKVIANVSMDVFAQKWACWGTDNFDTDLWYKTAPK